MIVLWLSLIALSTLGGKAFTKLCSNAVTGGSRVRYLFYLTVNASVACVFFWISGGFRVQVNSLTLLYSFLYALVVFLSLVSSLLIYRYATVAGVNIITSLLGLVVSVGVGLAVFSESLDFSKILRILVMMLAALFVFLDAKGERTVQTESRGKRKHLAFLAVLAVTAVVLVSNAVIVKSFTLSTRVTDENSFFFLTNAVMIALLLPLLFFSALRDRESFRRAAILLHPRNLIVLSGNTVCSNIGSLAGIRLMAEIELSVYTPIVSAIGVLSGVVGSLLFRERLGGFSYLAAAVALLAVVI